MTYFFANKSILNRTFETLAPPPHLRDTGYLQGKKKIKISEFHCHQGKMAK